MKRVQDWLLRFRWQKLLLVWGVFLLIAAVNTFALGRLGDHYRIFLSGFMDR